MDRATFRGKAGLVYGSRYAFIVRAPAAWTLDNQSGKRQGLQVVLYPTGQSWAKSPSVMYCQVVPKGGTVGGASALIAEEEARFRSQSPEATVEPLPEIRVGDSATALVRRFSGGRNHAFEATAYVEERTVIVSLILSCRTREAFDAALPAFTALVRSYRFLADDDENILRAIEAVEAEEE